MAMPAAPYFDLQVNGFAGVDFQRDDVDAAGLDRAMEALLRHGTGKILLTLITDHPDALCRRLEHFRRLREVSPVAREVIAGFHLEGPWLLPEPGYHGAHDPLRMSAPDVRTFDLFQEAAGGLLRLVTLAPELPGSPELISYAASRGVRTAIGHSNASAEHIDTAIQAGMTLCTHVGNGVPVMMHRHNNVIQRVLARDELTAVFIPDGIHLLPGVLRNFVRAKPPGKVLFTTDCMAAAGAGPGRYSLAHVEVEVGEDGVVREPGKETFAGSSLTMDRAVENVSAFLGWSREDAVAACSVRVACMLGL
jgi:N-acetylglucosamine-6-phosphate deacetylase